MKPTKGTRQIQIIGGDMEPENNLKGYEGQLYVYVPQEGTPTLYQKQSGGFSKTGWVDIGTSGGGGTPGGAVNNVQINDGAGGFEGGNAFLWSGDVLTVQNDAGDNIALQVAVGANNTVSLGDVSGAGNKTSLVLSDGLAQTTFKGDYFVFNSRIESTIFLVDSINSIITIFGVPEYASDALAIGAGLTTGQLFKNTQAGLTALCIVP